MDTTIRTARPDELVYNTIVGIQVDSFLPQYLKVCGYGLHENFNTSSFVVAEDAAAGMVGYLMYMKPGDVSQPAMMDDINQTLGWRRAYVEGGLNESGLIQFCESVAGRKIADTSQIQAFELGAGLDQLLNPVPGNTSFFAEIAVQHEFRGRGTASAMIEAMEADICDGSIYCYTKNQGHVREIIEKKGYTPIFQYGPLFFEGTSFVMMGKIL